LPCDLLRLIANSSAAVLLHAAVQRDSHRLMHKPPDVLQGRVGVHHVEDAQQSKNFTFKCHRDGTDIYAVNAITFHPVHGTFVTAGSDGAYNFWDKVLALMSWPIHIRV
jgi:hypothetical protein